MIKNKTTFGIILYLISCLISVCSTIFVKKVMIDYKIPSWEAIAIRQSIICVFLIPFMIKKKFNFFNKTTLKPNLIRNIIYALSVGIMHTAMLNIPVNNGTSLQFLTPIIATIMAIFLLKEKNHLYIWISLFVCLCGVCVIQKPSFDNNTIFYAYVLLFISILLKSFTIILNRKLALKFDTSILIFYMHIIVLFVSLLFFYQFVKVSYIVFVILGFVGIFYLLEYMLIYTSYKYCNVVLIQPLEFSKIIYSIILSNFVLGEETNFTQIIGISIIIFGFLIMFFAKNIFLKKKS